MRDKTDASRERPWPRIERATRAIIADRLTRGATDATDRALLAVIRERRKIERAGWFNWNPSPRPRGAPSRSGAAASVSVYAEDRYLLVAATRADDVPAATLNRLMASFKDDLASRPCRSNNSGAKSSRSGFDAVGRWLDERPNLGAWPLSTDEAEAGRIAFVIDGLLKYEGDADAQLAELMQEGSAYWDIHNPGHEKAIEEVTALHRRRFGG